MLELFLEQWGSQSDLQLLDPTVIPTIESNDDSSLCNLCCPWRMWAESLKFSDLFSLLTLWQGQKDSSDRFSKEASHLSVSFLPYTILHDFCYLITAQLSSHKGIMFPFPDLLREIS